MTEKATEATPSSEESKKDRKLKPIDIVAIVVVTVVVVVLGWTIYSKLKLKHDVAAAQQVSDQTIAALQKRDGAAAYKLGSANFKKTYTAKQLSTQFNTIEVATTKSPALENTTVYHGKDGETAYFIYKYSALKVPYYVRTAILHKDGKWQLVNISGSADESKLLITN